MAHVAVVATGVQTEQGLSALAPGMAATAEIKTGRRSVISYLLSPLARYAHESGGRDDNQNADNTSADFVCARSIAETCQPSASAVAKRLRPGASYNLLSGRGYLAVGGAASLTFAGDPQSIDPILRIAPLEEERIHPVTPLPAEGFPQVPGKRRFIIANHISQGEGTPLLYLQVPEEYVGPGTGKPDPAWGLNLLTWFPNMKGARNPENKERAACLSGASTKFLSP